METDTYLTIDSPSEVYLFKEKNSKFFGYAFPVKNEEDVKSSLESVRQLHKTARHFCYAYQIGTTQKQYRANDDGEPNNSAGMPIYGQILSFGLTNVLIVVVRYFGGIKLGVGGLISAYKTTAQEVLNSVNIVTKTINVQFQIQFDYKNLNKVMRIIKEKNLTIVEQKMNLDCEIIVETREKNSEQIAQIFIEMNGIDLKKLDEI